MPTLTLRSWMLVLALAMALPLVAAVFYALHLEQQQQDDRRRLLMREKAVAAAAAVATRVDLSSGLLKTLEASRADREGELPALFDRTSRLLAHQRLVAGVVLAAADGTVLFRATPDGRGALAPADGPGARIDCGAHAPGSMRSGREVVTVASGSGGEEAWLARVSLAPTLGPQGGCRWQAELPMQGFGRSLREQGWPSDWIASIVDRDFLIVSRSAQAAQFVGQTATQPLRDAVARGGGAFEGVARDGTPVMAYTVGVPGVEGWHVAVGISRPALDAEARASAGRVGLASAAAIVFGCLVAGGLAHVLSREVRGLAADRRPSRKPLVREVGEVEAVLDASRRRLLAVHLALMQAQEAERRLLARELHDQLGQELALLQLTLQDWGAGAQDSTPADRSLMREGSAAIERLVARVRSLALDLRPAQLDDLGLAPALRTLLRTVGEKTNVRIEADLQEEEQRLPEAVETALFRVAQASVTNALRHARARTISVKLAFEPAAVVLTVRDDGCGFDLAEVERRAGGAGIGLVVMRERMQALGGSLEVETGPGGTLVRARVPRDAGEGAREIRP